MANVEITANVNHNGTHYTKGQIVDLEDAQVLIDAGLAKSTDAQPEQAQEVDSPQPPLVDSQSQEQSQADEPDGFPQQPAQPSPEQIQSDIDSIESAGDLPPNN